jgi:hypothetical protein
MLSTLYFPNEIMKSLEATTLACFQICLCASFVTSCRQYSVQVRDHFIELFLFNRVYESLTK